MNHDQHPYVPSGNFDPIADLNGEQEGPSPTEWLNDRLAGYFQGADTTMPQVKTVHVEGRPKDKITIIRRPGDGGYHIETETDPFAKLAPHDTEVVTGSSSTTEVVNGVVRAKKLNGKPYEADAELQPGQSDEAWAARLGDRLARSTEGVARRSAIGRATLRAIFGKKQ